MPSGKHKYQVSSSLPLLSVSTLNKQTKPSIPQLLVGIDYFAREGGEGGGGGEGRRRREEGSNVREMELAVLWVLHQQF